MKIQRVEPARLFSVGIADEKLSHVATISLEANEQITFLSPEGMEYDLVRKQWGYYATPSLQGRLRSNGMRAALTRNVETGRIFVVLVEIGKEQLWRAYNAKERQEFLTWLDELPPQGVSNH